MSVKNLVSETNNFTKGLLASAFASACAGSVVATVVDMVSRHTPDSIYVAALAGGALTIGATATLIQKLDRAFDKAAFAGIIAGSVAVAGAAYTFIPKLL